RVDVAERVKRKGRRSVFGTGSVCRAVYGRGVRSDMGAAVVDGYLAVNAELGTGNIGNTEFVVRSTAVDPIAVPVTVRHVQVNGRTETMGVVVITDVVRPHQLAIDVQASLVVVPRYRDMLPLAGPIAWNDIIGESVVRISYPQRAVVCQDI